MNLTVKMTSLNLGDLDRRILDAVADHLGVPRATVIRWAIRHYAQKGPWTRKGMSGRRRVLGKLPELVVGPSIEES